MVQKRVHMRIEDLVEVELTSNAADVTTIMRTKTRDISAGGVKVYLNHMLNPGDRLQLAITLPNKKESIKTEAEVVSSDLIGVIGDRGEAKLYETRLKFIKIDAEAKKKIIQHVYHCRRQSHIARMEKQK